MSHISKFLKIAFLAAVMAITSFSELSYAEKIIMTKVMPAATTERTIYYNNKNQGWDYPVVHPWPTGQPSSNFSVSIPVKNGDFVEVTIAFGAHAYMHGAIVLAGGSAVSVYSQPIVMSWYPPNADVVWANFTMKAIYRATSDSTLVFKPEFWAGEFTNTYDAITGDRWCLCYFAEAEVVSQ